MKLFLGKVSSHLCHDLLTMCNLKWFKLKNWDTMVCYVPYSLNISLNPGLSLTVMEW